MREIKFRFIFKDGNFFATRYRTLVELLDCSFAREEMEESINSETLSNDDEFPDYEIFKNEYTGLKDKLNKNEVYEHDIINTIEYGFLKVEWDYRDTGWVCIGSNYKKHRLVDILLIGGIRVGNIHENPELLK